MIAYKDKEGGYYDLAKLDPEDVEEAIEDGYGVKNTPAGRIASIHIGGEEFRFHAVLLPDGRRWDAVNQTWGPEQNLGSMFDKLMNPTKQA